MVSDSNIWCVIMAGGAGTRIWPISTIDVPKQFKKLDGTQYNLLQTTRNRFTGMVPDERTIIVTNRRYEALVKESFPDIPAQNILLEPYKKDTAPCIAYAAYTILKRDPNAIMVVVPSDHMIQDEDRFRGVIRSAVEYVQQNDVLMPIGIHPTRPDANYGYIQAVSQPVENVPVPVKTFTEKPDLELAKVFVQSGEFLWNSGIFVWKADTIIAEIERFLPKMAEQFKGWQGALGSDFEVEYIEKAYAESPKISIDYAVMEKTSMAMVYPADFGWFDIGSWESLYNFIKDKDENGNATNVTSMLQDSKGNFILSTDKEKLIAVCGLDDYIIVNTDKVLLLCPRDDAKFRYFISNLAMPEFEKFR